MTRRGTAKLVALATIAATVGGALLVQAGTSTAQPGKPLERGNAYGEWRHWGADQWSTRYSPLEQINATNFDSLQVAWEWKGGAFGKDEYYRTTPLYANGRLFTVASTRRVATALDPSTGETLWMYRLDEGIRWQKAPRQFAGRGVSYWTDGARERILLVTPGYHLVSLDAKTGKPDAAFGKSGVIDLMEGLGYPMVPLAVDDSGPLIISDAAPYRKAKPGETWDPVKKIGADGTVGIEGQIAASSPAMVVGNVLIVGNSSIHGYYPIKASNPIGTVRAFDIPTGRLLWKFNLVPQPGEYGADSWKNGSKQGTKGVGKVDAWAPYAADEQLGLVYIPVGMPLMDEYGGHRPGDNLFGNSLVALDVKTGKRKWHFQMVHHDIWDYDAPMAPNLMDVTVNGRARKVVAQPTKQGWLYVFDRATGEPIWPIEEKPVLASGVPGEKSAPTQPIPSKPAPYSQQGLVEADLIDYMPAIKDSALALAKKCRMGPYYIPPAANDGKDSTGFRCAWYAPGASGGVNIDGGATMDPETGLLYVASITGLSTTSLANDPCSEFAYSSPAANCGLIGALPAPAGYKKPENVGFAGRASGSMIGGISIVKPKEYGGITAYDMKSGDKAWWMPNAGFIKQTSRDPLWSGVNIPQLPGRGQAQAITTKSLVIYGTGRSGGLPGEPPKLFALDKKTGKQVGALEIPAKTTAVPMTFLHKGDQYIVFATGAEENTSLVALKLPRKR
ncbi:MAG TPA: PQQ-binding-like beta-propeller repeat protein [Gemmatimonas sp.]|uniref:outer membrane protein assembly factor BamB family protein n=1 Tax=Gemmatimonas sp. TaxID=1962908 RepID=UPI002ED79E80